MAAEAGETVLLSVIVPAYNYGHLLRRTLDSALSQLRPDCELLVIDDGSTDDTPKLLDEIEAQQRPGFRHVRQDNAGPAAARNAGLRLSRGEYLLFLDADDELLPGALDAVCAAATARPQASVLLGGRFTRRADGREKYHSPPAALASDPCARLADYLLRKKIGMGHGSTVVRRELIARRPYPESLRGSEDIPVFARLFVEGEIATIARPLVRIHKHADSLRHLRPDSEARVAMLTDEIFRGLPASCGSLRGAYAARRSLSLFRIALRQGETGRAFRLLRGAVRQDVRQAFDPRQIRKNLAAALAWLLRRRAP
ncbi:MAG TPA: glycosyltransferase family 2 protein [Candidatus Desulfobacillus sp.]|nr:glycosyltransferase family 2 protein [Candidatus Desulfobacillus sp.]